MTAERQPSAGLALPIACSLDEGEVSARVSEWRALTDRALVSRERVDEGIRLTFRREPGVAETLARLIELEGRCCAWMSFDVTTGNDLLVDVSAADAMGRRTLAEMFGVS